MKTKRLFAFILALVMCVALLPMLAVSADGEEAVFPALPTVADQDKFSAIFKFHEGFEDAVNTVDRDVAAAGGFWLCEDADHDYEIKDGVLTANKIGMIDMNFSSIPDFQVKETFLLSFKFMSKAEGFGGQIISEVRNSNNKRTSSLVTASNGVLLVGGVSTGYTLPLDEWILIETVFHYNTTGAKFDKFSVMLNGTKIAEAKLSGEEDLHDIKMFRTFRYVGAGKTFALDEVNIALGDRSLAYAKSYDDTTPPPELQVPSLPTVSESELKDMEYLFHDDFSTADKLNPSDRVSDVQNAGGVFIIGGYDENDAVTFELKDGALYANGLSAYDLQFVNLKNFKCRENFMLSFRFKPLSENMASGSFIDWRVSGSHEWENDRISISKGHLFADGEDLGLLPVNEWTLIELAFHYNSETKMFDTFTVLVNGNAMKTLNSTEECVLTQIKHFRMFRNTFKFNYMVDDMNVVLGNTSMIYAKPYVEDSDPITPPTVTTPVTDAGTQKPTTSGTTPTPSGNQAAPATGTNAVDNKEKGCASMITAGAIVWMGCIALAGVQVFKKKD